MKKPIIELKELIRQSDNTELTELKKLSNNDDEDLTMFFWEWMDVKQLSKPEGLPNGNKSISLPNWFFASRTIQDRNLSGASTEVIDEFPVFSFLLADLHPHVLALPFVLLAVLISFEWLLTGNILSKISSPTTQHSKEKIILSALVFGSLIFLNTWDFPIYAFVFFKIFL